MENDGYEDDRARSDWQAEEEARAQHEHEMGLEAVYQAEMTAIEREEEERAAEDPDLAAKGMLEERAREDEARGREQVGRLLSIDTAVNIMMSQDWDHEDALAAAEKVEKIYMLGNPMPMTRTEEQDVLDEIKAQEGINGYLNR